MAKSDIVLNDDVIDVLGRVTIQPDESDAGGVVQIFPGRGNVRVGGAGEEGDLVVQNAEGQNRIHLDGGANNFQDSPAPVYANPFGTLRLGSEEQNGRLLLRDDDGTNRISIVGGRTTETSDDSGPVVGEGATPPDGPLVESPLDEPLLGDEAQPLVAGPTRVRLDGRTAVLRLGGDGQSGDLVLHDPGEQSEGGTRIHLSTNPEEETHITVEGPDGSTLLSLSPEGVLDVANTVVVDDDDLLDRLEALEDRVEELEGGS